VPPPFRQDSLAVCGRIDRNAVVATPMALGASVLRFRDVTALAEALEFGRLGTADAVNVARGNLRRAREPDEERVEVGALAAEVTRLEHRLDITQPAPAHLRVAEGVLDDPFVDGLSLVGIGGDALRAPLRRFQH